MNPTLGKIIETLTAQQDYLWFCALLLWVAMGAGLVAARRNRAALTDLTWPLLTLLCGAGIAVTELVAHVLPPDHLGEVFIWRDLVLFLLQFGQALAPIGLLVAGRSAPVRGRSWVLTGGIVTLVSLWRSQAFLPADVFAHTVATVLGFLAVRTLRGKDPLLGCAALLAVAGFLVGTTGIFSEVLFQQRRFVELSGLALPSVLVQSVLAFVWVTQLLPGGLPGISAGADGVKKRPVPWLWPAIGLWLVAGFVTAWLTGRSARAGFEDSLLARARVCTAFLRAEGLEAIMQPAFRMEAFDTTPQPNGRDSQIARSSYLLTAARQTRHDLARIQAVNPDIFWAYFMTVRGGWLVAAALQETLPAAKDVVVVQRRATARDLIDWATRRSYVEGPLMTDYDTVLRICAPVTSRSGAMLGWLTFEASPSAWAKAQAMARFQTFALMGVGSSMMLLILILRQRTAAQEEARRQALSAGAADQAKTVFLAKVSHELRTPVQSILGYSELVQDHPDAPARAQWIQALTGQGRLLIRLVNDLIDLSALQSGAFRLSLKPCQLPELVQQTVESMRPLAAAKGLAVVVEIAAEVPAWLLLDEVRTRQVLINLLGNAVKFTSRGSVRVRLQPGPAGAGRPTVVLSVQDTGPGISPENQSLLFRPFQRLEAHLAVEGAGLGLALSRALCEALGGGLTVESDGATGSTFTALWSFAPCAAPEVLSAARASLAGRRVLVVDDNALVAEFFLAVLRAEGAWCDRASTGVEAVALAARTAYDAITMDLSMPGLDGATAARQILAAATGPRPRIIGVSAHVQPEDHQQAVAAGMENLLIKPVSSRDLLDAIALGTGDNTVSRGDLALIRRLRAQFDLELPGLHSTIALAVADRDFTRLRERVHYLKNSADIVQFAELSALCARVEAIASPEAADYGPATAELLAVIERLPAAAQSPFRHPAG